MPKNIPVIDPAIYAESARRRDRKKAAAERAKLRLSYLNMMDDQLYRIKGKLKAASERLHIEYLRCGLATVEHGGWKGHQGKRCPDLDMIEGNRIH